MPPRPLHDESALAKAYMARQPEAFEQLYDRYAGGLLGVVVQIVRDEEIAADILQDAFVRAWRNAHTYDPSKGRLFTWLLNIARNAAIDHLRSTAHKIRPSIQPVEESVGILDRLKAEEMDVDHIGLKEVMNRLDPEHRRLLEMAYFQGYSQSELAEVLGLPLGTVKSRMRAALMTLRNWMS